MKKFIYSLGLSFLVYQSAWAQNTNQNPAVQNVENAAGQNEDMQTIFFSEDFLDELSGLSQPSILDDNIPLEKAQDNKQLPQENLAPNNQEKVDIIYKPVSRPKPQETTSEKPQNQPNVPLSTKKAESVPTPKDNFQPQKEVLPQPIMKNKSEATSEILKRPAQNLPMNKIEIPTQDIKPSLPKPVKEPETLQKPAVRVPNLQERLAKPTNLPERNIPTINSSSQALPPSSGSVLVRQPQTSFAPKPKSDAFSLDTKAPIPSSLIQEDSFATNILNKGINISPEQRAKMMMRKKYDEMDLNRDGVVSQNEFIQYKTLEAQKISEQVFNQIDRNGDNVLSDEEYDLLMNKMIDNYIKNPQQR